MMMNESVSGFRRFFQGVPKWWLVTLIGFVVSATVELIQYFNYLGLFEFDDIIHNTIGMLIGWGIVKIVDLVYRQYF